VALSVPVIRGSVVTAAGLVLAFTMASLTFGDRRVLGTIGTTIALPVDG
jgi:RND superfamily putative drug exporter